MTSAKVVSMQGGRGDVIVVRSREIKKKIADNDYRQLWLSTQTHGLDSLSLNLETTTSQEVCFLFTGCFCFVLF